MNIAISNLAWAASYDSEMYEYLKLTGIHGIEIAPTRIFPNEPYKQINSAKGYAAMLWENYRLSVPSMQSIWYGKTEKLFGSQKEREALLDYSRSAVYFAEALQCGNLVFGCPRNRVIPEGITDQTAVDFFRSIGEFAQMHGAFFSIEANPSIYNTNYITTTGQAFELVKRINCQGIGVNLDLGTMIYNDENEELLRGNVKYIKHVHISEPGLLPIQKRPLHKKIIDLLHEEKYGGYISIEMGCQADMDLVKSALYYIMELIHDEDEY